MCGEKPDDVVRRVIAAAAEFKIDASELDGWLFFAQRALDLTPESELAKFVSKAKEHRPFDLVIADIGLAHSGSGEDANENDNTQARVLAENIRSLGETVGGAPAVFVAMHPPKGATKETMQLRGGGAFAAPIDGEIALWRAGDKAPVEMYRRMKFRGSGFDPMFFDLKKVRLDQTDNFGEAVTTVVAIAELLRDDFDDAWSYWLDGEPDVERFKGVIRKWLAEPVDWDEADWFDRSGTNMSRAKKFFEVLPRELLDALGVVIVDSEHPASLYYAAELRGDIDAANAVAAARELPFRFAREA